MGHHHRRRHGKRQKLPDNASPQSHNSVHGGNAGPPRVHNGDGPGFASAETDVLEVRQVQTPQPSTVVSTVIEVVRENGSVVTQFTVPTLPATLSNSELGIITVPAESDPPVNTDPPASTSSPAPTQTTTSVSSDVTPVSSSSSTTSSAASDTSSTDTPSGTSATSTKSPPDSSLSPSTQRDAPAKSKATSTETPLSSSSSPSSSQTPSSSITTSSDAVSATSSTTSALTPSPPASIEEPRPAPIAPSSLLVSSVPDTTSTESTIVLTSSSSTASTTSLSSDSTSIFTSTSDLSSTATSSTATPSTSTVASSETSGGGGGGGGGGRWADPTDDPGPAAPTPPAEDANVDDGSSAVPVPKIVGGVVGGVAGAAILVILIVFILRLRKRRPSPQALASGPAERSAGNTSPESNDAPLTATVAGASRLFDRWRRSSQSFGTSPVAPGERGFQKLGGRKIQSVLETGGDGYDDPFNDTTYATGDSSAHPAVASGGVPKRPPKTRIGESSQPFPSPPLGRPGSQESDTSEQVMVRPSPARTPVTGSTELASSAGRSATTGRTPMPPPSGPIPPVPSLRATPSGDGVGRSHASADTSRTSRFTEGI